MKTDAQLEEFSGALQRKLDEAFAAGALQAKSDITAIVIKVCDDHGFENEVGHELVQAISKAKFGY